MKTNSDGSLVMKLLLPLKIILNIVVFLLCLLFSLLISFIWFLLFFFLVFFLPFKNLRAKLKKKSLILYRCWHYVNKLMISYFTDVVVTGDYDLLARKNRYIFFSNHYSLIDIAMIGFFQSNSTLITIIMKKSLLWTLPVFSWFCRACGFPFLSRSDSYTDIINLQHSFHLLKSLGNSLIIFPEGTRFSLQKKCQYDSHYQYLLNPRLRGLAESLYALEDYIDGLVDITIVYSGVGASLASLLTGKITRIYLHIRSIELDESFFGDFSKPQFKKDFAKKINSFWQDKDNLIDKIKKAEV